MFLPKHTDVRSIGSFQNLVSGRPSWLSEFRPAKCTPLSYSLLRVWLLERIIPPFYEGEKNLRLGKSTGSADPFLCPNAIQLHVWSEGMVKKVFFWGTRHMIRSSKHRLITKLIIQIKYNLHDESTKLSFVVISMFN